MDYYAYFLGEEMDSWQDEVICLELHSYARSRTKAVGLQSNRSFLPAAPSEVCGGRRGPGSIVQPNGGGRAYAMILIPGFV